MAKSVAKKAINLLLLQICLYAIITQAGTAKPKQWQAVEFKFTAEKNYELPIWRIDFGAVFKGPNNISYKVGGFWDGGKTFKIRFTPITPGKWSYKTYCSYPDRKLHNIEGSFIAETADSNNPLYHHGGFLKVSENKRYLTYTDGQPFFWLGDTWWYTPSDLMPLEGSSNPNIKSAYKTIIQKRRQQRFTTIHMAFHEKLKGYDPACKLLDKTQNIEPAYWQEADRYIKYTNDAGIIPIIALGWYRAMDKLSIQELKTLWKYVIARYGAYPITWLIVGEYNQAEKTYIQQRVLKTFTLGRFIKDTDPYKRAMTAHPWWYPGDTKSVWDKSWYDFIMLQGSHGKGEFLPPIKLYTDAYNYKPTKPVLEGECRYEGIWGYIDDDVRHVAYRAIQAGSFGFTYGSHGLWYPTQNEDDPKHDVWGERTVWWKSLQRPGAEQMKYLRDFFELVDWWKLVPKPDEVTTKENLDESLRILTKAEDDKVFLIYFPQSLDPELKAELTGLRNKSKYSARWLNPRTGQIINIKRLLRAHDNNLQLPCRKDNNDWLLLLKKK